MKSALLAGVIAIGSAGVALAQASGQTAAPVSQPRIIKEVKPTYPPDALVAGTAGTVELECVVMADGRVGDIMVIKPLDPALDEAAITALKQWQFAPAMKDGKPVETAVTIEMSFTARPRGPKLDSADVYKVGIDVVAPKVVKDVKPSYTPEAMRARMSGAVQVECVVLPDGTVGDARVTSSLHPQLDAEALKAVRQWRFEPGTKDGKAVPVQVSITMTFTFK